MGLAASPHIPLLSGVGMGSAIRAMMVSGASSMILPSWDGSLIWGSISRLGHKIIKYALLVFQPQEPFDRPRDSAMIAAGKAYGEALRAAWVVVTAAGLQPPHSATMVSVRDGK